MKHHDDEQNQKLSAFLKANTAEVPPPPHGLEDQIMSAVRAAGSAAPSLVPTRGFRSLGPRRFLLPLMAVSLSAAAAASVVIYQEHRQTVSEENDAFMASNWQGLVVGGDDATEADQIAGLLADSK